jgi:LCP family protein required for cell wall assembly
MSDDPISTDQPGFVQPLTAGSGEDPQPGRRSRRKRRAIRLAVAAAISMVVVVAGVAISGFAIANHLAGNIHRIPNVFVGLDAADQPVMPAATRHSMTILLTGSQQLPAQVGGSGVDNSSTAPEAQSGLISLVHINADKRRGAIVNIPPNVLVHVPGHGTIQLSRTLDIGGPSLLIRTVEHLSHVRIDHYSVVDFSGLESSLVPLGGVDVDIPDQSTSNGVTFHPGINHLTSATALDYLRETSLTEEERVLRQQAFLRAILDKIAAEHLLTHPMAGLSILNAFTKALSVDSDFTNSQLESLALHLHLLGGKSATFVTAPVHNRTFTFRGQSATRLRVHISRKLWRAIRHDAVAAFARRYPFTVTPNAPL